MYAVEYEYVVKDSPNRVSANETESPLERGDGDPHGLQGDPLLDDVVHVPLDRADADAERVRDLGVAHVPRDEEG